MQSVFVSNISPREEEPLEAPSMKFENEKKDEPEHNHALPPEAGKEEPLQAPKMKF